MALLERVSTLLRANLNDLIEKAEDPERLLKQLVLDMENQLLQVKTQVAIAIADQHLLERSAPSTSRGRGMEAQGRARGREGDGRPGARRARAGAELRQAHQSFAAQAEDQRLEADTLRQTLRKLDQKLSETRAQCEMLMAEHRRAKIVGRAAQARQHVGEAHDSTLGRMKSKVRQSSAESAAVSEVLAPDTLEDRFRNLEESEQVEMMLGKLKNRAALSAPE
jgi:phage shock protein A